MKLVIKTALLTLSISTLAGCMSLKPPTRPDYTGQDNISSAQASQLIGVWSVRPLNPYPNEEPQSVILEYRADNTLVGQIVLQGENAKALGNMSLGLSGDWSLEGDIITHVNTAVTNSGENLVGSLVGKLLKNRKHLSNQGNIYELSSQRLVVVGSDGAAMEYIKQ